MPRRLQLGQLSRTATTSSAIPATATVTFSDIGQLAGPVTVSGGVTTGTVIVNHATGDGQILDMQVTGLNPPTRWTISTS